MIKSIVIRNFRIFESFTLTLNPDLNIVVGNNEAGKSTLLEAIGLALTKKIGGRQIEYELSPFLFNKSVVDSYLASVKEGTPDPLPSILIELYLADSPELECLRGSNNSLRSNSVGVKIEVGFDDDYKEEYAKWLEDDSEKKLLPAEYYKVNWLSFANGPITSRSLPLSVFFIDATTIRLQSGTDYYIQNIISDGLAPKEKVALAVAYRRLKEQFSAESSIQDINKGLIKGAISEKELSIALDISQKSSWESSLVPHLNELPFQLSGKGEQTALKIMLALERKAKDANVILIEEPENHLSYSSMAKLIAKIGDKCAGKQIIIATHSAYVLNKLGIDKVILLHNGGRTTALTHLSRETQEYFKKLSGYDTLRLILARKAILVEGPSDELLVQKAYLNRHGKLPIEDGVDVINVRGLSFKRFLEIAKELGNEVSVVTDNDRDFQRNVLDKYAEFHATKNIKICADSDDELYTLEVQMVKINGLQPLNDILGTKHSDAEALLAYMLDNKTECALALFETRAPVKVPNYLNDAVE